MDLLTPIDITKLNDSSRLKAQQLGMLAMKNIEETLSYLTIERGIPNIKDFWMFEEGSVLMPYFPSIIGAGKDIGKIEKRTLMLDIGMLLTKADEVERYRNTWTAENMKFNLKANQNPFGDWFLKVLMNIEKQDLDQIPFLGVKNAVGTTPKDITNGFHKIVDLDVIAGTISVALKNQYAAAAYTAANIGDQLKEQYQLFPDFVQQSGNIEIFAPWNMRELYRGWLINKYTYTITDGDVMLDYLDGTNKKCKINWLSAMGTSQRVYMTSKDNLICGLSNPDIYGPVYIFNPGNNVYLIQATKKYPIGFQLRSINYRMFNTNNIAIV